MLSPNHAAPHLLLHHNGNLRSLDEPLQREIMDYAILSWAKTLTLSEQPNVDDLSQNPIAPFKPAPEV